MLHPSTKKLIDKLGEMTLKQKVAWIEGENGTIVHDTEGYRVVLTPEPHSVLLTDAVGREIETCSPEEIADETDTSGRPYAQFVGELFREAHRHARGAEKAIQVLLAGLAAVEEAETAETEPSVPVAETEETHAEADESPLETSTDETAALDGETEITAAVATLADQINGTGAELQDAAPEEEDATSDPAVTEAQAEPLTSPLPSHSLPAAYAEEESLSEVETEVDTEASIDAEADISASEVAAEPVETSEEKPETPEPSAITEDPSPPSYRPQHFSLSGIVAAAPAEPDAVEDNASSEPAESEAAMSAEEPAPAEEAPAVHHISDPAAESGPKLPNFLIDGTEDLPQPPAQAEPERIVPPQSTAKDTPPPAQPVAPRRFNPWN